MAKKTTIETVVEEPSGSPAPPTLSSAALASTEAEAQRLADLVEKAGGPAAPREEAPPAKSDVEAYNEWYESLPEDKRNVLVNTVVTNYDRQLEERYSPEVMEVLAKVSEDPELKKKLSRLSDEKFRSWVFDTAASIYDDPRFASPAAGDGTVEEHPQVAELAKEVRSLKTEREKEKADREYETYRQQRVGEYEALLNTHPELRFTDATSKEAKRVNAIIEEAERRSQQRKQVVPYGEVYKEFSEMWDWQSANPPPKAAPATSSREVTGPQAPRTKFESRAGMNAMLDKHGSIGQLAAALKR